MKFMTTRLSPSLIAGFELMYHDSGNTMHFSFFKRQFYPPTQEIKIPKKVSFT